VKEGKIDKGEGKVIGKTEDSTIRSGLEEGRFKTISKSWLKKEKA